MEPTTPTQAPQVKKVFIVEDDVFLGKVLGEQIRNAHFSTTPFTSGEDALVAIKANVPDLVLLDIFLPGMNGLDMLAEVRKDEKAKGVKVIVVSNTDEAKDRARATELGARFLIKAATSPDEIVKAVQDFLGV